MVVIGFIGQAKLIDHIEQTRQRLDEHPGTWTNVAERLSLSKYRTGVDALLRRDESGEVDQARSLFAGGLPASASD
jgi:hypothetical protein